jgi:small-conductance mechanosensitive channel
VVIVPNSNLITGVVKNRVRSDRTGRVLVALQAPRSIDPQRVRALMERAARKHPNVLKEPAPRVFFKKIAETGLDFELFCVVPDVDMVGGVTSDLHFAIYADLAKEGIGQPEREVVVKGLDEIEDTLEELVDAVEEARDGQAGKLARRRRPEPAEAVAEPAPAAAPSPAKPARGRA